MNILWSFYLSERSQSYSFRRKQTVFLQSSNWIWELDIRDQKDKIDGFGPNSDQKYKKMFERMKNTSFSIAQIIRRWKWISTCITDRNIIPNMYRKVQNWITYDQNVWKKPWTMPWNPTKIQFYSLTLVRFGRRA